MENLEFSALLKRCLKTLGINQRRLAGELDMSEAQVSGWSTGQRQVSRENCNLLAHTLTRLAEPILANVSGRIAELQGLLSPRSSIGLDRRKRLESELADLEERRQQLLELRVTRLDLVLNRLLAAGRYAAIAGAESNVVWNKITSREDPNAERDPLNVAWFPWAPLIEIEKGTTNDEPEGFIRDIADAVSALLGIRFRYRMCQLPDIPKRIMNRDVDLVICQYIATPERMLDLAFSNPLPHILCTPNAVLHKDAIEELSLNGSGTWRQKIDTSRLQLLHVDSDIASNIVELLNFGEVPVEPTSVKSLSKGIQSISDQPREGGLFRCFVTESFTARDAARLNKEIASLIPSEENDQEIGLGLGFAALPTEPKLIRVINAALSTLERNAAYLARLYGANEDMLRRAGALTRDGIEMLKLYKT